MIRRQESVSKTSPRILACCDPAGTAGVGVGNESSAVLMPESRIMTALSSAGPSIRPANATVPSAVPDMEKLGSDAAHDKAEQPQWLRFFFNPHTPLQSAGVWPLRRDFLTQIAGEHHLKICRNCRQVAFP